MSRLQAVASVTGLAAPLMRDNIDTDIIIPSREITSPTREGYGPKLFAPWRYREPGGPEEPGFILNREPWRQAKILLAGQNFGCGSSREMAVWALAQFGLACVIAPSFGAIFRNNCIRNGLLPVTLALETVRLWADQAAQSPLWLTVDLQTQQIATAGSPPVSFEFDAEEREQLLTGQDAIDRAWQHRAAIEAFEARDRLARPWAWPLSAAPRTPVDIGDPDTR